MWVPLALSSAILAAISIFIIKHLLRSVHPISLVVLVHLFTIPFMILLFFYYKIPVTTPEFFLYITIAGIIAGFAAYTSYKALSYSQISLIIPLSAFLPILTLVWAYFLLGEAPTLVKLGGILIIVIGAYFLDIHDIKKGVLQPFKDLVMDKGARFYLFAVLAWSITPIFEKQAVLETTPQTPLFAVFISILVSTSLLIPFAIKEKVDLDPVNKHWGLLILLGILHVLFSIAAFTAFTLTNVAYVTAIGKLATLFVIMLGAFFMHEKRLKERALGGFIMVIGAILVVI